MKLSPQFNDALIFAANLHGTQVRKGTDIPYISHLLAVSSLVLEFGGTEIEAIAGLLHDAIEDQGGAKTRAAIRERFGDEVTGIVDGCTDAEVVPKPPWKARKEAYVAHLGQAPNSVRLVSGCDKLHNARSILADYREHGEALWRRFNATRDDLAWYYRSVADILLKQGPDKLAGELDRVVRELELVTGGPR